MTTYPDGYASPPAQKTIEQVFARASVQMLDPEYQKRWRGLMIASGGRLGIGGAGRSSAQQQRVFLERHNVVTSGGCCQWNGKRYQLKTGMAHAAPPGLSFHEDVVYGRAAAVDAVGDLKWAALNCEAYGLEQADWGGEVWHFQFTEFPRSVSSWRKQGSPRPQNWTLPGTTPTPTPTPPSTSLPAMPTTGAAREMYLIMKYGGTPDANWSGYYSDGNKRYQINATTGGMDHVARLVRAGAKDAKTNAVVSSTSWAGVSHTTNSTELTKYLGPA